MNTQVKEAQNMNEVSAILLGLGYMVYRPEADVGGVYFLIKAPKGPI